MKSVVRLIIAFICMCPSIAKSQFYYQATHRLGSSFRWETGLSAGMMNAMTDIGGRKGIGKQFLKDFTIKTSQACIGLFAIATYREAVAVRLEMEMGSVKAYDSILRPFAQTTFYRYERGLSFRSRIREIQLVIEIHPFFFRMFDEDETPYFSPYIVGGIGIFAFDPETFLDGNWYALRSFHTEGQGFSEYPYRKPYRLTQFNFPLGLGLRYEWRQAVYWRIEIVHRFLVTDYLDDVSQHEYVDPAIYYRYFPPGKAAIAGKLSNRSGAPFSYGTRGNPNNNDSFFTVQLKIGWIIGGG